jgi:DNA-binding beta-propeller fold protein YncE
MAEREGFEPSIEFPLYTLSKRAPSTTRPSLRLAGSHQNNMRAARDSRIENVARSPISRRTLLLSPALALAACRKPKATRFPGYCFVANQDGRSVAVVDLSSFRVCKQIHLDAAPTVVLRHPQRPVVFVLAPQGGTVYEIDAASLAVGRTARAGSQAVDMRISPRGEALWVLYRDPAALVEVPLSSLRPARRIRLSTPPDDFDLSSENRAAIASRQDRGIVIASLTSATIERTIAAGAEPSIVRFQLDGKQLIAGSRPERSVTIFDVATGKTVVRLPLPLEPRHFCFTPDGGQLFISGDGMDAVVILYPYQTEVEETILAGHAPGVMAITDTSPSYLLVANPETSRITVFDVDTRKLVAAVQVGRQPGSILITPDNQYILVLNEQSGDLAVIRIFSLAARYRYKPAPLFTMIPVGEKPVGAAVVAL